MAQRELFNASVYLIDRQVEAGHGARPALLGPNGTRTYAQLAAAVHAAAAGWRALGIRPEERVVLVSADREELLVAFLSLMRIGAVPVPVSTMYRDTEIAELLVDSRARAVVASPEFADAVHAAVAIAGGPELLLGTDDVAALTGDDDSVHPTWEESPALWLYTSGTTGVPKAAMHRHGSVRFVAEQYGRQVLGITSEDRCLSVAKLFFAYGLGNSALFPLSVGATTILEPARPTPDVIRESLEKHRPTLFFGVPTFYAGLLAADLPPETFSSVRLCVSAGEPLPAELYRRFTERFGVDIVDGIGSTEALHIFLSNRPGQVRPGTTGVPVPGYDLRLVDDEGAEVAAGTPGHLQIRGGSLTTGYWCRTDTTRAAFVGEWMRTGDTYVQDADGYYACLGRSNDMIKAGGIWVSPGEVEACLLAQPGVAQAAVVAVPDADGLDKPVACVVAAPNVVLDPDALIAACRESLAAFKRPRHVLVVDALPQTATGKVRRFQVREIAQRLLESHA
ncbi:MAG: benzoate-CoA ligase family protein [Sporichthyaceae bacterium]